jgi:hypothetical protein
VTERTTNILDNPLRTRGAAFARAEPGAHGLTGRLPAAADGVATRNPGNLVQAVQCAIWQPVYSDSAL